METKTASFAINTNAVNESTMNSEGALYVKVMTDEQMEVLRRQISDYAAICEQLVEMHKAITARNESIAGMRLGNLYCDPSMSHKISARQRWTPMPVQLQILETIFDQSNGNPSKQKIKEISLELAQHGQISETNVYNWFQNRRARSKRKQTTALPNNNESEAEAEIESPPSEKKAKLNDNSGELSSDSKSPVSPGQMSFYENMLANQRSGSYSHFHSEDGYEYLG